MFYRTICVIFIVGFSVGAYAGEIVGIPPQLVPTTDADFSLNFSNDFLGRGGSVDDFRTAQIIVTAEIADNWFALLDHSTLTLEEAQINGRVDQVGASFGYRFIDRHSTNQVTRVTAGGGLRAAGDYSGEPMQNGFHRIVGSEVTDLPYADTNSIDLTLLFIADHYKSFHTSGGEGFFGGWKSGYWIRASSLVTSDSQWDNALGAYAVTSKNSVDIWLGARRDWRSGYDQDIVQRATAAAEDDLAFVVGLRWGALVLETVQQVNNEASYGQLSLIADGREPFPGIDSVPRFNIEFGFILPDVQIQLAGKVDSNLFVSSSANWRESILIDARVGEPQYEDNASMYIETRQLSAGIEWERQLPNARDWISAYGALGVGWRVEKLLGGLQLTGEQSDSVGRVTATLGSGLRFTAADFGAGWRYRLQLGVTAWLPGSDAEVQFAGETFRLQKPGIGVMLGMTFDYE